MVVSVSALDIEVGYRHRAQGAVEIGTVDVGFDVGINCGILELVCKIESGKVDMEALQKGLANLTKHIEDVQKFGLPAVVAINAFPTDTKEELDFV